MTTFNILYQTEAGTLGICAVEATDIDEAVRNIASQWWLDKILGVAFSGYAMALRPVTTTIPKPLPITTVDKFSRLRGEDLA